MGLTLTTDDKGTKIFRKEHDGSNGKWYTYSTKASSKDQQDNWNSAFIDIVFKKGVTVNNKAVIKIKNAFPTVTKYQEKTYLKWMVLDFEVIDKGEEETPADDSWLNVPDGIDDEAPFFA